jgi:chemotaxis protein CheD
MLKTSDPVPAPVRARLGSTPRLERLKAAPRRPGQASFFYYDSHFHNEAVKVLPGEFFVGR